LDAVEKGYGVGRERIVTRHPLQSVSRAYFTEDSGLFSYAREDLDACLAAGARREERPFFRGPLTPAAEDPGSLRPISAERLVSFLSHPAKFLARERLGLRLPEGEEAAEESEPFTLDSLSAYRIGQALLDVCLDGRDPRELHPAFRAAGELPHGPAGDILFGRVCAQVRTLGSRARDLLPPGGASGPLDVACEIGGQPLGGRLPRVTAAGCLQLRYAAISARDYLQAWVAHLLLQVARPGIPDPRSLLMGRDAFIALTRVPEAAEVLGRLLRLYRRGLTEPLHFFPVCALAYCLKLRTSDSRSALEAARQKWVDWSGERGEGVDPYNRLCHGKTDPLDEDFQRLAVEVFDPLLEHCESI
jgi:exodeoxyribonuclease V gamma subunit